MPVRTKASTLSIKKKNATISELRVRRESLLIQLVIRSRNRSPRRVIYLQAIESCGSTRAGIAGKYILSAPLKVKLHQRNLFICAVAIQTYFFILFVHGFLLIDLSSEEHSSKITFHEIASNASTSQA